MEDLTERRTLQDLQLSSLDGSMLLQTRRNTKRKCGVLSDATESTPTELIQQCSLLHSHQPTACRGKENHGNRFVLARRSRQQRELASGLSWDHLPDELLLRILFYLPLQDLLRMCTVCKRLYRLGFDEPLWHSVDLEGLTHAGPALQQVLNTGVCRLRCPHSFIEEPPFTGTEAVKIVHMDLSGSIIPTPVLESILCRCQLLECLSVEGLQLSDHIVHCLSRNPNMLQLNVSGCSGFSAVALGHMLASLSRMEQLNISWCDFSNDHVKSVVSHVSSGVVQLNLSGYRQNLTLEDVKVLVLRCPNIETLDLR
ncbi:S-phase kinase-associated protein 2 [Thalassophryne amazonica]|uniref:S-phase kinase-associated protein 2 n=1 Tax=Thalassophryne amazonica TaxID=390379 RepID=UPI001471EC04|nr:S-phase kinase-associated protein 2 [Thalassophryne amazonica]